jgi:Tn7-like transposition protein D/TniQ
VISCFPDPYPDEILYSVCARYSDRLQYPYRSGILHDLFGSRHVCLSVDLPCRLGHLVNNLLVRHIYTTNILIDHHTLLPYYAPFLPPERLARVREQMVGGNGLSIHRVIGLTSTSVPSPLWIRYCPLCVKQDRVNYGEAYWHRLHQVPGVEICPEHTTFLENSTILQRTVGGPRDLISTECALRNANIIPRLATPSSVHKALLNIALDSRYLLEHPVATPPSHFFRAQYSALLQNQGFLTEGGKIRSADLLKGFVNYYSSELLTSLRCEVNSTHSLSQAWLVELRFSRSAQSPLHHLLAIRFLGTTIEGFFSQEVKPTGPFGDGPWPCLNPVCKHYQQNHISSCRTHEKGRGHFIGKFECTCGFAYYRYYDIESGNSQNTISRSKVFSYGELWEQKLREMWLDPTMSLGEISRRLGVVPRLIRQQAIKLQLPFPRSFPGSGVVYPHQKPNAKKECSWYRSQWLAMIKDAPEDVEIRWFRRKAPGIYIWLLQHDKAWFNVHRPSKKLSNRETGRRSLDAQFAKEETFQETDENLDRQTSSMVLEAANKLATATDPLKRVTFNKIALDVPDIIWLRLHPDKAPLTIQALQRVTETCEQFAIRRIWWLAHKLQAEQVYPTRAAFIKKAGLGQRFRCVPIVQQAVAEAMDYLLQFS